MNAIDIEAMDLNLLKVFEALYEEGGASRAAIRLGLTQSAVSAAIGRLRRVYGDPLFERAGRGMRPTARAQELKPVVSEALNHCRKSLSMVAPGGNVFHERTISIGLSDDYEIAMGRRLVDRLAEMAPGIRLLFRQTHSQKAVEMLVDRSVDLIVAAGGLASRAVAKHVLGMGGYACLVPAIGAPARGLTLEEYVRRKHILISSGGFVGIVDEALAALGLKRRVEVSTTHFAAVPFLLRGNDTIATLPAHAAHALAGLGGFQVLPCPVALPRDPIELAWRMDVLRDPAVAAVKQAVVDTFANMAWIS
ncbi:LysR family transcriptional regulator [Cupriavidus sp. 2MCAB6]|uniref:LysR family transcriptional regulator n=1 Tax=Cupriavidus sp. 2MCAB6 TaxID=3232981 RepID=UPI003F9122FB